MQTTPLNSARRIAAPAIEIIGQRASVLLAVAVVCLQGGALASAAVTYDFESLNASTTQGDLNTGNILGQDNWVTNGTGLQTSDHWYVVNQGPTIDVGSNSTKVLSPTYATDIARDNDANFSVPIFNGTEKIFLQADFRIGNDLNIFQLHHREYGNPDLSNYSCSPWLGFQQFGSPAVSEFEIRASRNSTITHVPLNGAASLGDWVRMRLDIDLAANGGDGVMSASYMNLTLGQTSLTSIAGMQNLPAGLNNNPAAFKTHWNGMYLRSGINLNGLNMIDNLTVGVVPTAVPGDFDGDGDVDGADFVAWQTHFPTASGAILADGDADGDGDVDGADFVVWQTNFPFTTGPGVAPVPEPQAFALATIGVAMMAGVWKRKKSDKRNQR